MRSALCCFTLICCWGVCHAQATRDSLKTFILPTVRVVIGKNSEAIGSVTHLRTADLGQTNNLREAFINSPGISATIGSKDESNLRLRGFRKNEVKILVDGRPLTSGYFGNVDISKLPLLNISEIQIVKGPASPLYGTNNMGGIVNIITNPPGTKEWLTLQASLRRNNTQDIKVSSSHSFGTWSYNLGAATFRTNGFVLSKDFLPTYSENGGVRNNSAKNQFNLFGGISSDILGFHSLGMDFNYNFQTQKNIPSSVFESKYRRYEDWMRYNAGFSGQFAISNRVQMSTLIANDGAADRYLEYADQAYQRLDLDSQMENQSWVFQPRWKWIAGEKHTADFGFHFQHQKNSRKDNKNYQQWTSSSVINGNAFCQYEYQFTQNYRLTTALGITGSRMFDKTTANSSTKVLPKTGYNKQTANTSGNSLTFIPEPSLGLFCDFGNGMQSAFAMGISSAQPTMRQLFSYDRGNPNLKPQYAYKAELSHLQPLYVSALSLSASAYINDTRELIDLQNGKYNNIYRVVSYGCEAGLNFMPHKNYELEVNYAYLDYHKQSDYRLTETPANSLELLNRLLLPFRASLQVGSIFRDKRVSQDEGGIYHDLNAYWLHNAQLKIPWRKLSFSLGISNILDSNYQGEYGFPEPGRDFNLGLELKL